ncbi:hypothetical protein Q6271_29350, partial [Klebsiella pneumoniae]|nr:hypothetical protein [Klebsiella pneumoniae]
SMTRSIRWSLTTLATAALLAACNTAPEAPQATLDVPMSYKEAAAAQSRWKTAEPAEAQPRGEWWRAFGDAQLDALQAQA